VFTNFASTIGSALIGGSEPLNDAYQHTAATPTHTVATPTTKRLLRYRGRDFWLRAGSAPTVRAAIKTPFVFISAPTCAKLELARQLRKHHGWAS